MRGSRNDLQTSPKSRGKQQGWSNIDTRTSMEGTAKRREGFNGGSNLPKMSLNDGQHKGKGNGSRISNEKRYDNDNGSNGGNGGNKGRIKEREEKEGWVGMLSRNKWFLLAAVTVMMVLRRR